MGATVDVRELGRFEIRFSGARIVYGDEDASFLAVTFDLILRQSGPRERSKLTTLQVETFLDDDDPTRQLTELVQLSKDKLATRLQEIARGLQEGGRSRGQRR